MCAASVNPKWHDKITLKCVDANIGLVSSVRVVVGQRRECDV